MIRGKSENLRNQERIWCTLIRGTRNILAPSKLAVIASLSCGRGTEGEGGSGIKEEKQDRCNHDKVKNTNR